MAHSSTRRSKVVVRSFVGPLIAGAMALTVALALAPAIAQAATASATVTVSGNPGQPVFSPDGSTVYVPGTTSGKVDVIDVATASVSRTITIPGAAGSGWGLGISPDGTRIYATDNGANKLYILNAATGTTIGSAITVGDRPAAMAVTPDGSTVFVANWSGPPNSYISSVNTSDGSVTNWLNEQVRDLVVSPDGLYLYATVSSDEVLRIKLSDRTVLNRIPTGRGPNSIAVTPNGSTVIVGNADDDTLTFIRTADWTTSSLSVGDEPDGIVITPNGSRAYVSNHRGGTISVVDLASRTVTDTVVAAPNPWRNAVSPLGTRLYVASMSQPKVFTFEIAGGGSNGSRDTAGFAGPRGAMQQFGVPSGTTANQCAALVPPHVNWLGLEGHSQTGWSLSYAEWPNDGRGGFVCGRDVRWTGTAWVIV